MAVPRRRSSITVLTARALPPGRDRHVRGHARRLLAASAVAASPRPTRCTSARSPAPAALLLGAAFAMVWRPVAMMRGPMRNKGRLARPRRPRRAGRARPRCAGTSTSSRPSGADPWLFRGGFFADRAGARCGDRRRDPPAAWPGRLLGNPVLLWIGTRSYGLYLYHWPIYQIIRRVAGTPLTIAEFVLAHGAHGRDHRAVVPVHRDADPHGATSGAGGAGCRRARDPAPRRVIAAVGAGCVAAVGVRRRQPGDGRAASRTRSPSRSTRASDAVTDRARTTADRRPTTTVAGRRRRPGADAVAGARPRPPSPGVPAGAVASDPATTPTDGAPPTTAADHDRAAGADPILAIGDSVMLGAADELAAEGITVDAKVSRQMVDDGAGRAGAARQRPARRSRRHPPRHQRDRQRGDARRASSPRSATSRRSSC